MYLWVLFFCNVFTGSSLIQVTDVFKEIHTQQMNTVSVFLMNLDDEVCLPCQLLSPCVELVSIGLLQFILSLYLFHFFFLKIVAESLLRGLFGSIGD